MKPLRVPARDALGLASRAVLNLLDRCGYELALDDTQYASLPDAISPEAFEAELVLLGLSGKEFSPEAYARALERRLRATIEIHYLNVAQHPGFIQRLALERSLGQTYFYDDRRAHVLVPENLSPTLEPLVVYHELSHIAMGDHPFEVRAREEIAEREPSASKAAKEEEANVRACYALVFGILGDDNPYCRVVDDWMRHEII